MLKSCFRLTLSIVIVIGLSACDRSASPLAVAVNEELVLNTNWPYSPRWSGVLDAKDGSGQFIFSGDPLTQLVVRVFDDHGATLFDIPLTGALDSLGSINSFTLIEPELLFVIEEHGPRYALLNKSGEVIHMASLADLLCDTNGDLYEVNGYSGGLTLLNGHIILETDWISHCSDTAEARPLPLVEVHRQYFAEATSKCKVASLLLGGQARLSFGACNILPHLLDTPRCTIGGVRRTVANNRLFVISPYSSKILELDTSNYSVLDEFDIELNGAPVGITPPPVNEEDVKAQGYNTRLVCNATITSMAFDHPSQRYLVTIYHDVPERTEEDKRGIHREWTLNTYDENFDIIDDQRVLADTYLPGCLLSLADGVWILVDQPGNGDARAPKVFNRINIR